ncbi:MAG: hypothetical protein KA383_20445 [Phycisphaerae bacterium]|nr:hypothetical protein [Phycisphaerae bacterium]
MRRLCAYAEALCHTLAPHAATGPFCVVLRSDLPPEYQGGDGGALALTSRHLDLMLRPTLERQRRWRGRGPAILLDPAEIAAHSAKRIRVARRSAFRVVTTGVALHELAHIVNAGPRDDAEPDPDFVQFGRLLLAADLTGRERPTNGPDAAVPWLGHEWPFIRTALHLMHRADALGYAMTPVGVFDAATYGLSSSYRYLAALGDEPERLAGWPITKIGRVPPPFAFTRLWDADARAWMARHGNSDEVCAALATGDRRNLIPHT